MKFVSKIQAEMGGESESHHNEAEVSLEQAIDSFMHYVDKTAAEDLMAATDQYVAAHKLDEAYMASFAGKLASYCEALEAKYMPKSASEDSTAALGRAKKRRNI